MPLGVGVYTPIESSASAAAAPRPVYRGLEFAQMFAGGSLAACALETNANMSAYQASKAGKDMWAVVNKGGDAVRIVLPEGFARANRLDRWELRGPSLDAKSALSSVLSSTVPENRSQRSQLIPP